MLGGVRGRERAGARALSLPGVPPSPALSGAPVPRGSVGASLPEAQKLVQAGAQVSGLIFPKPAGQQSIWPLTPTWPPGSCSLCLDGGGSWCVCFISLHFWLQSMNVHPPSTHRQSLDRVSQSASWAHSRSFRQPSI